MKELSKYWTGVMIRGIIAILFGLVALFAPALALEFLVLLFGAFALVDGVVAFFLGMSTKSGVIMLEGIVGILVGLYIFFFTGPAVLIFLLLVAVWAIVTGILEIMAGVTLRKHLTDEIFLLIVGVISVVFGFWVYTNPIASAIAISWAIGIYAIIFGMFLLLLAHKLKSYVPTKRRR
ncbi:MAG TPA: HdeD family acid-resistance protein [Patescibacteria group bacterium]|nr:HdeD family acid-resistance protein [Patescibacteria group bacterium]